MTDENISHVNEIHSIVKKADNMLRHISENSELEIDSQSVEILIDAKYRVISGEWTREFEHQFWGAYGKLVDAIHPVTSESLSAFSPKVLSWFPVTLPSRFVLFFWSFGLFSFLSLVGLVMTHSYWLIGTNVYHKSQSYFKERESKRLILNDLKIESIEAANIFKSKIDTNAKSKLVNGTCSIYDKSSPARYSESYNKLDTEVDTIDQKLDESKRMLNRWNMVWLQLLPWETEMLGIRTIYEGRVYKKKRKALLDKLQILESKQTGKSNNASMTQAICDVKKQIEKIEKNNWLEVSRSRIFLRQFSTEYALLTLETFLLPLLYGLLGACVHIMRTLTIEVKRMSFTPKDEVCYIIRVCLGGLGGLIIGWFLKPDDLSALGNFSAFAIAFLVGYNIETLFAIMDRFLDDSRNLFKSSKVDKI